MPPVILTNANTLPASIKGGTLVTPTLGTTTGVVTGFGGSTGPTIMPATPVGVMPQVMGMVPMTVCCGHPAVGPCVHYPIVKQNAPCVSVTINTLGTGTLAWELMTPSGHNIGIVVAINPGDTCTTYLNRVATDIRNDDAYKIWTVTVTGCTITICAKTGPEYNGSTLTFWKCFGCTTVTTPTTTTSASACLIPASPTVLTFNGGSTGPGGGDADIIVSFSSGETTPEISVTGAQSPGTVCTNISNAINALASPYVASCTTTNGVTTMTICAPVGTLYNGNTCTITQIPDGSPSLDVLYIAQPTQTFSGGTSGTDDHCTDCREGHFGDLYSDDYDYVLPVFTNLDNQSDMYTNDWNTWLFSYPAGYDAIASGDFKIQKFLFGNWVTVATITDGTYGIPFNGGIGTGTDYWPFLASTNGQFFVPLTGYGGTPPKSNPAPTSTTTNYQGFALSWAAVYNHFGAGKYRFYQNGCYRGLQLGCYCSQSPPFCLQAYSCNGHPAIATWIMTVNYPLSGRAQFFFSNGTNIMPPVRTITSPANFVTQFVADINSGLYGTTNYTASGGVLSGNNVYITLTDATGNKNGTVGALSAVGGILTILQPTEAFAGGYISTPQLLDRTVKFEMEYIGGNTGNVNLQGNFWNLCSVTTTTGTPATTTVSTPIAWYDSLRFEGFFGKYSYDYTSERITYATGQVYEVRDQAQKKFHLQTGRLPQWLIDRFAAYTAMADTVWVSDYNMNNQSYSIKRLLVNRNSSTAPEYVNFSRFSRIQDMQWTESLDFIFRDRCC